MQFNSRPLIGPNGHEASAHLLSNAHMRAALRAQAQTYFPGLSDHGPIARETLKSHPLRRLSAVTEDIESDLLLIGGDSWQRRKYAQLALDAPCSVWLVPRDWAPVLRRVLVPIDFSERSVDGLRAAIEMMRPFPKARCLALHVYQHDTRFQDERVEGSRRRALVEDFSAFMAGVETSEVAVEPIFAESHCLAREISRTAQQHGVDLVVMTTRGRTPAARLILPSDTEQSILQCPSPFLVLKTSDPPVSLGQALRERLAASQELQFS